MQRIRAFESLRGLLALWVITYHVALTAGVHAESWRFPLNLLGKGEYAVDIFIILSGFVIFALLDNSRETYRVFLIRRAFRLYPIYLMSLAVSVVLTPFFISTLKALPWWNPYIPIRLKIFGDSMRYFWPQLIAHATLLHGVVPDTVLPSTDYAFIGQAWSISLEWQFYLIAPLFYKWISEKKIARAALLSLVLIVLGYLHLGGAAFLPKSAYLFFAGIASYYGYRFVVRQKTLLAPSAAWVAILPPVFALLLTDSIPLVIFSLVYSLVLGSVLMPRNRIVSAASGFFESTLLLYLGRLSYCMYLTHMILLYVCAHFLIPLFQSQWAFFIALLGSVLVCVLPLSALLSQYVEYPLLNFGKGLTAKRTLRGV